jgi:hypothetical protein
MKEQGTMVLSETEKEKQILGKYLPYFRDKYFSFLDGQIIPIGKDVCYKDLNPVNRRFVMDLVSKIQNGEFDYKDDDLKTYLYKGHIE